MKQWFWFAMLTQRRQPTPPLLPRRKRRELLENFQNLDREGRGFIETTDIVDSGLMDEEMASDFLRRYDSDGSGHLGDHEFLEMCCPHGFRAHKEVKNSSDAQGQPLKLIEEGLFTGWLQESDWAEFCEQSATIRQKMDSRREASEAAPAAPQRVGPEPVQRRGSAAHEPGQRRSSQS